jgi:hypothetical protein
MGEMYLSASKIARNGDEGDASEIVGLTCGEYPLLIEGKKKGKRISAIPL